MNGKKIQSGLLGLLYHGRRDAGAVPIMIQSALPICKERTGGDMG